MPTDVSPSPEAIRAQAEEIARRRKNGWRLMLLMAAILLGLLTLVPTVIYFAWLTQGRRLLQAELDAIKAKGQPITTAEMNQWQAIPEGTRDITPLWVEALRPFDSPPYNATTVGIPLVGTGPPLPALDQPIGFTEADLIRKFLDQHRALIARLHKVAREEGAVRYQRDFSEGIGMILSEVQQVRSATRALELEFHTLVRNGKIDEAIDNIVTRHAVGETLAHDPILISMLMRIAVQGTVLASARDLAATQSLSDEQLARLQSIVRSIDFHPQIAEALIGERAMTYQTFHIPIDLRSNEISPEGVAETTDDANKVRRPEDCAMALQMLARLLEAAEQPHPQAIADTWAVEQQLKQLREESPLQSVRYMQTLLLMPAVSAAATINAKGTAVCEVTDAVLAVRRYALEHGEAPPGLESLVPKYLPELPRDPFDGMPLRYRREGERVTIYSVGENQSDEGGSGNLSDGDPDIAAGILIPVR